MLWGCLPFRPQSSTGVTTTIASYLPAADINSLPHSCQQLSAQLCSLSSDTFFSCVGHHVLKRIFSLVLTELGYGVII